MSSFNTTIESNIPAPEYNYRKWVDNFTAMKPGDSFTIPADDDIRRSVLTSARIKGFRVVTRKQGDKIRVWMEGQR